MKKNVLLAFFLLTLSSVSLFSQEDPFLHDFLERWENSKLYLLDMAEAMPEMYFHTKPNTEVMSFAEQLMHISVVLDWHAFSKFDGREEGIRWDEFNVGDQSKEELIGKTAREFDRAADLIRNFDPKRLDEKGSYAKFSRTRRQFLLLLADHVSHHRGQMVVYLRLKGVKPPNYINYQ
ncbi:MAG: DinB family protein [Cyclobacteriaceae bacterium]